MATKSRGTRVRKAKMNALHTVINATAFQYAAKVLNDHTKYKDQLMWPTIVNEAFSLELFLKCLHQVRRRRARGHEPHELYHTLSRTDRKRIELRYNTIFVGHPYFAMAAAEGIPMDIESVLLRAAKLFTGGRYWHEGLNISRDAQGYATNAGVGSLSDAIRGLLFELKPDWRDKILKFKWKFPGNTRLTT